MPRMGDNRVLYSVLVERPEVRGHLENLGAHGRILLKWMFKKWYGEAWTGLIWLMIETHGGFM